MGIDDESSHPGLCSECVAGGVTRTRVCLFREPDAGNLPVRFDEQEQEPELSQTGLRRRGESQLNYPPGDYSHCAFSTLLLAISLIFACAGVLSANAVLDSWQSVLVAERIAMLNPCIPRYNRHRLLPDECNFCISEPRSSMFWMRRIRRLTSC
jgi:hypothetical protein